MLDTSSAAAWVESWDRQQEKYMADREERFQVIIDVVDATVDRPDPLVVDVGCGPGSLAARLVDRIPDARVVGVDSDPLLLGLAQGAYGARPGLRFVDADLRRDDWVEVAALGEQADAVVSTTALHWLYKDELSELYRQFGEILRPGGVYVDGDHIYDGPRWPRLHELGKTVKQARAVRVGAEQDSSAWQTWWAEVEAAPEFADLLTERGQRSLEHNMGSDVYYEDRLRLLGEAGFAEAGTVWQSGDDRVLVAVRA